MEKQAAAAPKAPMVAERRTSLRRIVHEKCRILVHTSSEEEGKAPVEAVLTDLDSKGVGGVGVSVSWHVQPGLSVVLQVLAKSISGKVHGKVVWCHKLPTTGRVIKATPMSWRAGIQILAETDEERQLLAQIIRDL